MWKQHLHLPVGLGRMAAAILLSFLAAGFSAGEAAAQRRVAPDSLRHIQQVSPLHGPAGTVVTIFTENLPIQAKVHVGVGATRTGFEALFEAQQEMWGEVSATVTIPESTPWDRAVVLIAFDAIFAPIGISDPFHFINPQGFLRRTGRITDEGVECLAMRDTDEYLYTLIGATDGLAAGEPVVIEGEYVETSTCMQGTTLRVTRVLPPPPS
ncbi:MAG: hypothetical protein O2958_02925 [Gemmatimonadetes bacterium]|nr:hypothetical protein [Gemmatimonadota bacterium]MDA1102270.1 hypothetical protein [Gemmatimonadota bacterium]